MNLKVELTQLTLTVLVVIGCHAAKNISMDLPVFDKQGHRGARGLMPENTIPAMKKAIDLGVTTLEMDVVITADSMVLVSHDPFFNHDITTLADGSFLTAQNEKGTNIFWMTYAETQRYDVGAKPHPKFPRQQKLATTKPLLRDLIEAAEAYARSTERPQPLYNIETKSNPATDGLFHPSPARFVELLMAVVEISGIKARTTIQSFDPRTLRIVHEKYPSLRTALLIEEYDKRGFEKQVAELGFVPTIYSPAHALVTDSLVREVHARGMKIIPWTVNDAARMKMLKEMGVDGIISDYPDLF